MSMIYSPKHRSTDLEMAIAEFLATKHVEKVAAKGSLRRQQQETKREEVRKAFLAKREREHMAVVDAA